MGYFNLSMVIIAIGMVEKNTVTTHALLINLHSIVFDSTQYCSTYCMSVYHRIIRSRDYCGFIRDFRELYEKEILTKFVGIFLGLIFLGQGLSSAVGGWLIEISNWRNIFILFSILSLLSFFPSFAYLQVAI